MEIIEKCPYAAEVQLRYELLNPVAFYPQITGSADVYELAKPMFANVMEHREAMLVFFLSRSNRIVNWMLLSLGGIAGTVTDIRVILQAALLSNASNFIMLHNHPSGNPEPSDSDVKLTKEYAEAGRLLSIPLLDHIVVTRDGYTSLADNGLM